MIKIFKTIVKSKTVEDLLNLYEEQVAPLTEEQFLALISEMDNKTPSPLSKELLFFLIWRGSRGSLKDFVKRFFLAQNRDLFIEVLRTCGLQSVNQIVEIRRHIPAKQAANYADVMHQFFLIMEEAGYFKGLIKFLEADQEKIILYSLKQFFLFPNEDIIPYLKPLFNHRNSMVRNNIVEILDSISTKNSVFDMLNFVDDSDPSIRASVKAKIQSNWTSRYPVLVERLENSADEKLNGLLTLAGELADSAILDRLTYYVINYHKPLNVRAFHALQYVILREIGDQSFRPASTHHRISILLKTIILAVPMDIVDLMASLLQRLGQEAFLMLLCEYRNTDRLERENLVRIFVAIKEMDVETLFQEVAVMDESLIRSLIELLEVKMGKSALLMMYAGLMEKITPELLKETLPLMSSLYLNHHILREKCHSILRKKVSGRWEIVLKQLGQQGDEKLLESIAKDILNEELQIRWEMINTLGYFNTQKSVEILTTVAHDTRPDIRRKLVEVLLLIDNIEATLLLFKVCIDEADKGNTEYIDLLVAKGKKRFFDHLELIDEVKRREISHTLARYNKDFVDEVSDNLFSLDFDERKKALELLTIVSDNRRDEVASKLRQLLHDPDRKMRAMLTKTIVTIGGVEAADLVISLMKDHDSRVRANAIEILPLLHNNSLSKEIYPYLADENNRVRANAVMALYQMGDSRALVAISEMLQSEDKWMRASAAFAMGEVNDPRTIPILLSFMTDSDNDVRRNVIKALGKIGDKTVIKHLLRSLSSEQGDIREVTSNAITEIKKRERL